MTSTSALVTTELIIRSADRVSGTPSDYTVMLPEHIRNTQWTQMFCHSVYMKGSVANVTNQNNTFWYSYILLSQGRTLYEADYSHASTRSVSISPGQYTQYTIATAIETAILNDHASLMTAHGIPALQVSLAANNATSKCSFSVVASSHYTGGTIPAAITTAFGGGTVPLTPYVSCFVLPNDGSTQLPIPVSSSLNSFLGFVSMSSEYSTIAGTTAGAYYDPFLVTATAEHLVDTVPLLFLECDAIRSQSVVAKANAGPQAILAAVIVPTFGSMGVWESTDPPSRIHHVSSAHLHTMHFRWVTSSNTAVDFGTTDHVILLRLLK